MWVWPEVMLVVMYHLLGEYLREILREYPGLTSVNLTCTNVEMLKFNFTPNNKLSRVWNLRLICSSSLVREFMVWKLEKEGNLHLQTDNIQIVLYIKN